MTVSAISSSGVTNALEFTNPAETVHTTGGALAALVLQAQATQQQTDHDELQVARDEYRNALSEEVGAMHEAASQVFWGAVAQGSLAMISGAASVYGAASSQSAISKALKSHSDTAISAACRPGVAENFGNALASLAPPVGKLVSGSDGQDSLADAKAASGQGEEAKWRIDDLKENIEQSKQVTDKTTQWLASAVEKQDGAITSVLSSMA
jgi:hypothetical protein